jgi:hypothetical protein
LGDGAMVDAVDLEPSEPILRCWRSAATRKFSALRTFCMCLEMDSSVESLLRRGRAAPLGVDGLRMEAGGGSEVLPKLGKD